MMSIRNYISESERLDTFVNDATVEKMYFISNSPNRVPKSLLNNPIQK